MVSCHDHTHMCMRSCDCCLVCLLCFIQAKASVFVCVLVGPRRVYVHIHTGCGGLTVDRDDDDNNAACDSGDAYRNAMYDRY